MKNYFNITFDPDELHVLIDANNLYYQELNAINIIDSKLDIKIKELNEELSSLAYDINRTTILTTLVARKEMEIFLLESLFLLDYKSFIDPNLTEDYILDDNAWLIDKSYLVAQNKTLDDVSCIDDVLSDYGRKVLNAKKLSKKACFKNVDIDILNKRIEFFINLSKNLYHIIGLILSCRNKIEYFVTKSIYSKAKDDILYYKFKSFYHAKDEEEAESLIINHNIERARMYYQRSDLSFYERDAYRAQVESSETIFCDVLSFIFSRGIFKKYNIQVIRFEPRYTEVFEFEKLEHSLPPIE